MIFASKDGRRLPAKAAYAPLGQIMILAHSQEIVIVNVVLRHDTKAKQPR
jgi:hypothetical protein